MNLRVQALLTLVIVGAAVGCASSGSSGAKKPGEAKPIIGPGNPRVPEVAVTSLPAANGSVAIVGATLLLGTGARIEHGTIVLSGGSIAAVGGSTLTPPAGRRSSMAGASS